MQLAGNLTIRMVSPPCFVATKIEAFHGRGGGDYLTSHDIEDLVAVVDGRPEINSEIEEAPDDLRTYLHDQLTNLLGDDDFRDALPGHLRGDATSQSRLPTLLWRLHRIHSENDEQALLRTLLDHIIDNQELPLVRQFRLPHEQRRPLLDDLVQHGLLAKGRGRYGLAVDGLRMCLPGRASDEITRCNAAIDKLKEMYRSEPDRRWSTAELAGRIDATIPATARAVTFLSAEPIFSRLSYATAGFVEAFSLEERVLRAEYLQ